MSPLQEQNMREELDHMTQCFEDTRSELINCREELARYRAWHDAVMAQNIEGYKFSAPGITKIDVWPHGGKWKHLIVRPQPLEVKP